MKIEKLPSGSYRVRKTINGQKITKIFDHKPSQKEITIALAGEIDNIAPKTSFISCARKYIEAKDRVLSPDTVKLYNNYANVVIPKWFSDTKINEITQIQIQTVINDYAVDHKPKTVRNLHGFISAVLKTYRPNMNIRTTLPQNQKYEPYVPSTDEVKSILEMAEGTQYHIPFQLGILGMRRGEICALTMDDIDGNTITIDKAMAINDNNEYVIKPTPKTEAGYREIYIPDTLRDEIIFEGRIYDGYPNLLLKALHRFQKKLGIPSFRFHDLRHYYATYAHSMGMSDADIMESGGWASDYCMKNIYRHAKKDKLQENQAKVASGILG